MRVLIDPVAVAQKVLATPNGWSRASVFDIKALAGYCIYLDEREAHPGGAGADFHGGRPAPYSLAAVRRGDPGADRSRRNRQNHVSRAGERAVFRP